ncbi:MAG: endonuclease/exonuclease/phosphatase family protein [Ekhidna sp.]|uniref:endonuclease/exonuclease/phosphatase family protein n=1 Tax=Ekhidna sp. TaxID=2608089 RepID=UPI0032ECD445
MHIVLIVLSTAFILSSVATLSKREEWWIRAFDFPYVHFTILGLICLLAWLKFLPSGVFETSIFILVVGFVIYRIGVILPYTPLKRLAIPSSEPSVETIKILSANVLMSNADYDGLVKLVKQEQPDILLLVEADEKWTIALKDAFTEHFPFQILHPLDNTYGMTFYSRLPIKESEIRFLIEENVPSVHTKIQYPSGDWVQFYGLHPKPPAPGENLESTPRDAELVVVGRMARESELPVIVAGDMNDVAWSHTTRLFMRISGLLDPRMGRGFYNTFHAEKPLLRWPLDHIFLSHHFRIASLKRKNSFGSDHFPIAIEVSLNPSIHAKASRELANGEDLDEAQAKLDKHLDSTINR